MTVQLKLVRLNDFVADIDSVDLLASGYLLAANGYQPVVAPIGAKSVYETITLELQGSSTDDLASMVQDIDEKIRQVQWWIDNPGVERYQVWLRVQVDEESSPRQAQIISIQPADRVNVFSTVDTSEYHITEYQIGIERTPFWEHPYPYPSTTAITALSSCGGIAEMSETINGDVPARIAVMDPTPNGAAQFGEYWIGFKSNRFGNPAKFEPVWSLSDSIYLDTDTSSTADATAVNGNKLVCTFGTDETLTQRTITRINEVVASSSEHADQRGSYAVLLRAKMSDTNSIACVRMLYSFADTLRILNPIYRARQTITSPINSGYWMLYPMGTAVIPSMRLSPGIEISTAAICLQAERISGSGNLELDCLVLIPIDDGGVHVASAMNENVTNGFYLHVIQDADGAVRTFASSSTYVDYPSTIEPMNFTGLIANNSKPYIVVAGQKYVSTSSQSVFTDDIDITYTYIPRWRTLRGSVT